MCILIQVIKILSYKTLGDGQTTVKETFICWCLKITMKHMNQGLINQLTGKQIQTKANRTILGTHAGSAQLLHNQNIFLSFPFLGGGGGLGETETIYKQRVWRGQTFWNHKLGFYIWRQTSRDRNELKREGCWKLGLKSKWVPTGVGVKLEVGSYQCSVTDVKGKETKREKRRGEDKLKELGFSKGTFQHLLWSGRQVQTGSWQRTSAGKGSWVRLPGCKSCFPNCWLRHVFRHTSFTRSNKD